MEPERGRSPQSTVAGHLDAEGTWGEGQVKVVVRAMPLHARAGQRLLPTSRTLWGGSEEPCHCLACPQNQEMLH